MSLCIRLLGPDVYPPPDEEDSDSDEEEPLNKPMLVTTRFYHWCCSYFAQSVMKLPDDLDPNSSQRIEREWRFLRNSKVRTQSMKQLKQSREFPWFGSVDTAFLHTMTFVTYQTTDRLYRTI